MELGIGMGRVREVREGKDSESGRGREKKQRKRRVCGEGMVGPRQEAAVVWGKDPWVQLRILAPPFPAPQLRQTLTSLNLTFLVYKKRITIPDAQGDYNE